MTVESVAALWTQIRSAPVPDVSTGSEIADCDLASLDSLIADCINTWLANAGTLDASRREVLASCLADLDRVLPQLSGEVASYFGDLHDMAVLVAAA